MRVSMDISFSTFVIACFFLINLVHCQGNSDFISIDCGVQEDYTDTATNIHHSSDAQFVNTGISRNISAKFKSGDLNQRLANLRSFPEGTRNCYTLRTTQGKNKKYLIRAWFLYGDYDGNNALPRFELNIGTNLWDTVALANASEYSVFEMMHISPTDFIHVCLVNIGAGTPFISALELRHVNDSIYKTQSESMVLYERYDLGSTATDSPSIGHEYGDELGRMWYSFNIENTTRVSTFIPIDSLNDNAYKLPGQIMEDADKPVNESVRMEYYLDGGNGRTSATRFYVYLHFCEIKQLEEDEVREFDILMNDVPWVTSVVPTYLRTTTITKEAPIRGGTVGELWFCLKRTERSTLPPILSAMEIYIEKKLPKLSSNPEDVDAMVNISLSYGVKKNWQGDPCIPLDLSWKGLLCSSADANAPPPQILSLNLSSSSLTGEIAPALASLKSLEHLDLSNNNLTGPVPEFLSQLPALKTLNLAGNNLAGSVPKSLLKKSSLSIRTDGNPNLCSSLTCGKTNKKNTIIAVVVSVVISLVILSAIATFWVLKMRSRKVVRTLKSNNQRFSYSEVVHMTNNFEKVIGKGGFGTVYLGHLEDGTEVAVKMLSRSSTQVSEQFWTEAELLTTIHHRNLASLVGYSEEGSNTALIYEYMANGNLRECLSDKSEAILTWGQRLQIAIDSAQALEYLHNGCKPPIIHRDIKTDNILLNESMQAKVADFGLSRIFPQVQGETHVSTGVVGTFGYLDPEYYITGRLTEKSDVYSFGIVLFELITGQPAIIKSEENTHIVQWVMPMLEKGDISTIVDERLLGDYDNNSVWKALETAVACVPSSPIQRPTMSQVLGDLKECQDMYLGTGNTRETEDINFNVASSTGIDYLNSFDIESSMIIPRAR